MTLLASTGTYCPNDATYTEMAREVGVNSRKWDESRHADALIVDVTLGRSGGDPCDVTGAFLKIYDVVTSPKLTVKYYGSFPIFGHPLSFECPGAERTFPCSELAD